MVMLLQEFRIACLWAPTKSKKKKCSLGLWQLQDAKIHVLWLGLYVTQTFIENLTNQEILNMDGILLI